MVYLPAFTIQTNQVWVNIPVSWMVSVIQCAFSWIQHNLFFFAPDHGENLRCQLSEAFSGSVLGP